MKIEPISSTQPVQQSLAHSLAASVAEEAMENLAQTKLEAAQGDRQAMQRLAAANSQSPAAPPSNLPESTGKVINTKA